MTTPMTFNHPETHEGEIFLGNFASHEALHIGWQTKRAGWKAYCVDGTPYPDQLLFGVKPYFVGRAEMEAVGIDLSKYPASN